jgi:16S rRNA (adenine(1408)-N(1))-methyltransferase
VLATAAREPRTLAIGTDASQGAMVESSRRAARPARKGGLPNAVFILAAAEAAPALFAGTADLVTVSFPWGSLLRGCVGRDQAVAAGVAGLVRAGGSLELLLAPSARDGLEGIPTEPAAIADAVAATFARFGLDLAEARLASDAEIRASASTWARRLRSQRPADRAVMLIRLVQPARNEAVATLA